MRYLILLLALMACTPEEVENWHQWHHNDPHAAEAFLTLPGVQERLHGPQTGVWDRLADCESGGNWSINTGNGFYGGLQFTLTSWRAVGGTGFPHQHPREEQIFRAERLQDLQGWGAWPGCARRLGLR